MDHALFRSLIQSLHSVGVLSFPEDADPPADFSEKYCYHPALQACFTRAALQETARTLPGDLIVELSDALGIRILLFVLDGRKWILGPFVIRTFQEKQVREALIARKLPGSFISSLHLYYSAFPLASDQDLVHSVKALAKVMCPGGEEYEFRHQTAADAGHGSSERAARFEARFNYNSIRKRYELENRFLRMIEEGDVEHVQSAFDSMGIAELNNRRYINAIYSMPEVGFAMIRALSRKAAERGGAPLMEINEITQRAVQKAQGHGGEEKLIRIIQTMAMELTEAVRRHRETDGDYSPAIRKAAAFIRSNYSQNISLEEAAEAAGYAPSYLSRQFKEETGVTVSEYIRDLRLREAQRLLRETDASVTEIGDYVGYPDNNYFIKVFRGKYGLTPGAYRKKG